MLILTYAHKTNKQKSHRICVCFGVSVEYTSSLRNKEEQKELHVQKEIRKAGGSEGE